MEIPISTKIKHLWNIWDLRVLIIGSLLLQAILILFASSRKRTGSKLVILVIWATYLLTDWVAAVAVGNASSSQLIDPATGTGESGDLLAFWTPFLLLHLGGPDSITSFSLEDNELWLRHLLCLVVQFLAVGYVFLQTLPSNKLWVPTTLVLVAGTIKCAERMRAMYNASLDRLGVPVLPQPEPGPEYEKISRRLSSIKKSILPTHWVIVQNPERKYWDSFGGPGELNERSLLRTAYDIFNTFKGLIVGQIFSSKERETSRNFFLNRSAAEAFKVVEVELSFMYEVLHTKLAVVRSRRGYALRLFCSLAVVASFLIFVLIDKKGFKKFDQGLTFLLLVGAMILETISLVMLVFSDRTAIFIDNSLGRYVASVVLKKQRWSESVSQCNLIEYCLARRSKRLDQFAQYLGFDDFANKMVMRGSLLSQPISRENLKEFIFEELKAKSLKAPDFETAEVLCSRGRAGALLKDPEAGHQKLAWSIDEFQYAESLLLWHIASDLCYHRDHGSDEIKRGVSKLLSDYMFYLLVMKPPMMGPVAGNWQLVFQDTCAEAKRFFRKSLLLEASAACKQLLSVETLYRSAALKGGRSKSVLFDACMLAKQLLELEQSERWRIMSQVWVEFMSYAAINCRPTVHAEQLSTGGELLTFIWLLNTQLGLGKQFYHQVSVGKVKILPRK